MLSTIPTIAPETKSDASTVTGQGLNNYNPRSTDRGFFFRWGGDPPPTFDAGVITPPLGVSKGGPGASIQETHGAGRGPRVKERNASTYIEAKYKNKFFR